VSDLGLGLGLDRRPVGARSSDLSLDVIVDAPPDEVWTLVTDWSSQGDWMIGTVVRPTAGNGVGLGAGLEAFTGFGRWGFTDPMEITEWDPPHRCAVRHTGSWVRGEGIFETLALPEARTRFVWTERLLLPLGRFGRAGWPLVRPALAYGVRLSLEAFARQAVAGPAMGTVAPPSLR
jgi:uncharacterized protein YndB with AHSA1/START domain